MKREIRDYLYDILHECEYLINRSRNMSYIEFLENEDLKKAFIRSLEIIGEAGRRIPLSIKKKYHDIYWREITGMRNKIAHEYFGIDYKIVWESIEKDIPTLKTKIKQIISEVNKKNHE